MRHRPSPPPPPPHTSTCTYTYTCTHTSHVRPRVPYTHTYRAGRRALALLHRRWEGDAVAALRDCEAAIELDPGSMKAHYRRAQALAACKLLKVGWGCCGMGKTRYRSTLQGF